MAKLKARGYEHAGVLQPEGVVARTLCTCCITPISRSCITVCRKIRRSTPRKPVERRVEPLAAAGLIATFAGSIFHYIGIGPNKEVDDDEEDHHE